MGTWVLAAVQSRATGHGLLKRRHAINVWASCSFVSGRAFPGAHADVLLGLTSSPSVQGLRERLPSTPGSLQEGPASADMWQYQSPCLKRGLSLDANLPNSDEVPRPHSSSELVVPVKRTFIHYDTEHLQDSPRSDGMRRCQSAPARLLSRQLGRVTEAHKAGTCKPCAYFFAKADGCRWHNSCEFCHLCPPGEIKKRKKQKKAFLRAEASKSQED